MIEARVFDATVEIPMHEYIDLLSARERMIVLWDYMTSEDYHNENVIKTILGIKKEK